MTRGRFPKVAGLFFVAVTLAWGINQAIAGPGGGTYYANSPAGTWTDYAGNVHVSGTPLRKFVDRLPGVGLPGCDNTAGAAFSTATCGANEIGQYIPVASKLTDPTGNGDDYYEIGIVGYAEKLHSDLPKATRLRGYRDLAPGADPTPHYLGPLVIAQENKPVRLKVTNMLPTGTAGNLFIPVDTTYMGAGLGPDDNVTNYSQNRTSVHLHGGNTPWVSDGTPHQWFTPAAETNRYRIGVSQQNVPDMPVDTLATGQETLYYTNQQSSRLMFYHDHAFGITRLNVYAGMAAGYLLTDNTEENLINTGVYPVQSDLGAQYRYGIPLIIQDKTFVPQDIAAQDALWDTTRWGQPGDLWFPHVYETNQDPYSIDGANPFGRWDYGPWFWPPLDPTQLLGPLPQPSGVPEGFMDTPVINGTAYPYLVVRPKAYRFRILNAANDRMWNLQLYYADPLNPTEVKMVPAVATAGFPADWPTDGRNGGVPDPTTVGPNMIQVGNEGGILPAPVTIPNHPVNYEYNRRNIVVLNVNQKALFLGPAERADVIIDFSSVPSGSTIILYNDAPAPVPAFDERNDYYTGDPDMTNSGGMAPTVAGYGPNTRTIMQFRVSGTAAAPFNVAALDNALPAAFAASQPTIILPESAYDSVYGQTFTDTYARIQDNTITYTPVGSTIQRTVPLLRKAIHELFELKYGRMNALLGVELPLTNFFTQTTLPFGYIDPPTEVLTDGETQFWKITHNGVDTHAIHFHLVNVQVINRVGWDGAIRPPDPWEIGWKETVLMNPLEDIIVAIQPKNQTLPFLLPESVRLLDPTQPIGSAMGFAGINPADGTPLTVTNQLHNYGFEYVWHCHLLGHEENDMMRAVEFRVPTDQPLAPSGLTATLSGIDNSQINLAWVDNSNNETGFLIQRAAGVGVFQDLTIAYTNATTYTDTALTQNTSYRYRIRAFNNIGNSNWSNITPPVTTGTFSPATGVTLAVHPASPQLVGTIVNFIATATGGTGTYQYQFEQRLAGAASWTVARTYTSSNNWIWNTSTYPAGNYEIHVLARTTGGTGAAAIPATSPTVPFVLGTSPATGVTLVASPATSAPVGTSVTFTSAASGGSGTYQYAFEWRQVGATAWTVAQAYSSAGTWVWNTAGLAAGNYEIQVLARNAGSTAASEATSGAVPYALTPSLLPATGAVLVAYPTSPQPPGTLVAFLAGGSGGSGTYQYQFSDNVSGVMTVVQPYSQTSAFVWNTTGLALSSYGFKVDVRVLGSTSASEATTTVAYSLAPLPATAVTLVPSPSSPQAAGTSVTWMAAAYGGSGTYQYQFSYRLTGTPTYTIGQAYGSSATWAWNTAAIPSGSYDILVNARSAGSTSASEASATTTYLFTGTGAATGVVLTPSPASPQLPGTSVTWTAAASGGSGIYEYKFWLYNNGWYVVKDYGVSGNSWTWDTTGFVGGTMYSVTVWARQAGSTAAYDAYTTISFLLSPTASSVSLTPSVASPQLPGTSVTWTATASGGSGTYEYRFWLYNNGWNIVKDYAVPGNSWNWDTTGLPGGTTYYVTAWARNAGSTASYETNQTSAPYVIAAPPASAVTLAPSPSSPQTIGTTVTLTASASGGSGTYEYRFWLYNNGWNIVKDYAVPGNSWNWDTTGLAAGTHFLTVWARDVGSAAPYEAYFTIPFDLQ